MLASTSTPRRATAPRGFGFPDVTSRNRAFSTFGTRRPRLASARTFRVAAKSSRPSLRGAANGAENESSGTLDAENGYWRVEAASVQRARGTLRRISEFAGERTTDGIGDAHLAAALARDHDLIRAIDDAGALHDRLIHSQGLCGGRCYATLLALDEDSLRARLTKDVLNFYPEDGTQPFVPLAARGPWIVTAHGAVVYDAGGYGMTGFGHSPDDLLDAVGRPEVMANVMTGSFAQADLTHALRREIGRNWRGANRGRMMVTNEKDAEDDDAAWTNQLEHPYASFACLNSGSEAVTLALRVTDVRARTEIDVKGKTPVFIALKGSFHGRTNRAGTVSHATHGLYAEELASFRPGNWREPSKSKGAFDVDDFFRAETQTSKDEFTAEDADDECDSDFAHPFYDSWKDCWQHKRRKDDVEALRGAGRDANQREGFDTDESFQPPPCLFVEPNDVQTLVNTFDACDRAGLFVEAMILEPCMGEGDPGRMITREFYDEARRLTKARGTFLVVDSVQAGLRATGDLSLVDWPRFASCEPPDFEVFSKALNGGQFPLSVVAFSERARDAYKTGIYGNTMTFNPRAARVGTAALRAMTPARRANVVERGKELLSALEDLVRRYPSHLDRAAGSGLLAAVHCAPSVRVTGDGGLEERCRRAGLNAVHGGENALRFTPWFDMSTEEVRLLADVVEEALLGWMRDNGEGNDGVDVAKPRDSFSTAAYASAYGFGSTKTPKEARFAKFDKAKFDPPDIELKAKNYDGTLRDSAKTRVARRVIDAAVGKYLARNPKVRAVASSVRAAAAASSSSEGVKFTGTYAPSDGDCEGLPLDHVAFRTFALPNMGIDAVAGLFTSLGYVEASDPGKLGDGPMRFPEKKVSARWFRPPDATPPLPRIFISELDVSDLSNAARATIEAYVGGTGDGEHGMLFSTQSASAALPYDTRRGARKKEKKKSKVRYPGAFADPDFHKDTFECVLDLIEDVYATAGDHAAGVASHMCCDGWDTPWDVRGIAKADFDLLTNESEYAAWTLVNGYAVNHVAIAAHRLPLESGIGDLRSLNAFLQGDVPAARLVPVTPPGDSPGPGDSPAVSDSEDDAEKAVIRREIGGYGEIPEERCFSERWEKFGEDGLYRFIVDPVACPTSGGPPNEWNDFEDEDDQTVDQTEPGSGVDAFTRVSPDGGLLQSSISADVRLVKLFDERVGSLVECAVPGGYLEFVQRRPLDPNAISANVPAQSLGDSALRDGFHEGNANGIFESTFRANTHPRAKGAADAGKGGGGEVGKGAKSSAVSWSLRRVRSAEKERDTFFVDADCDPSDEECHYAF